VPGESRRHKSDAPRVWRPRPDRPKAGYPDQAAPRQQDQTRPPQGARSRSGRHETAEPNRAPRESTAGPGRHEATEPEGRRRVVQGVVGHRRREAVTGQACYLLSEMMKFKYRSGRYKAGEPDQAATRWQKGRVAAGQGVVGHRRKGESNRRLLLVTVYREERSRLLKGCRVVSDKSSRLLGGCISDSSLQCPKPSEIITIIS
jgi:hypothetical protein